MKHMKADTMKKTTAILAAAAALAMTACNKSEILAPTDQRYIYMSYPESGNPVFNFSFISTTKETVQIAVPIKFAGRPLTEDLSYALKVYPGDEQTTLKANEEYELPELVFHKESFLDTIFVTVHKTARMENGTYNLKFSLESNENFFATQTGFLEAELRVTAQIAQPSWWNQSVVDFYLRTYSDKKFGLFSQNIFTGDYGELSDSDKRFYALKFKYWLAENPQTEEDGTQMKVAIQG